MLRISETDNDNSHVILRLEGRIIGPWVGELERASERIVNAGRSLKLDLTEVSYVDREGVRLLLALKRGKARLEGCSPFVLEELREAARAADTPTAKQ
jgi:anti-anti-sigma regulatory factor